VAPDVLAARVGLFCHFHRDSPTNVEIVDGMGYSSAYHGKAEVLIVARVRTLCYKSHIVDNASKSGGS